MIKCRLITGLQRNLGACGGVLVIFPGFSLLVQVLPLQHFRLRIFQRVLREGVCRLKAFFLRNQDESLPIAFLHGT
jgi:hypothetical protein